MQTSQKAKTQSKLDQSPASSSGTIDGCNKKKYMYIHIKKKIFFSTTPTFETGQTGRNFLKIIVFLKWKPFN